MPEVRRFGYGSLTGDVIAYFQRARTSLALINRRPTRGGNRTRTNPLAGRPETAAGGRKLFAERCSTCHGDDRRGTSKAPDLLNPDVQAQTDLELFWKLSTGYSRSGMPAFSFLPEPQRWQLVMHLRSGARKLTD